MDAAQIISINFEDVDNEPLCGYKALYEHVKSRMVPGKMNYIFLDEIQHVVHYPGPQSEISAGDG